MTEKRFIIDDIGLCILDTSTKEGTGMVYYDCSDERIDVLCDLLNKQHEEIVELREAMKRLMMDMMTR